MSAPRLPPLPPLTAGARVWVAYSGGADSTALLLLLREAGVADLRAVHVHHGLQAVADDWVAHCQAQCRTLDLPLTVLPVQVDPAHPEGPEGGARAARYAALRSVLAPGDLLVTAHHRDDQAETVLLRLLRGCGIEGAAAMAACSPFPPGRLWRPLLDLPRQSLRDFVIARGLAFVEDPHNRDPRYARVRLRQEILPLLQSHWPQAAEHLGRFARHAEEARTLLGELAEADLAGAGRGPALSVSVLLGLSPARRRNLLRHWFLRDGLPPPGAGTLDRLEVEVLRARPDATPWLKVGGQELRRYRDGLWRMPPLPPAPPAGLRLPWTGEAPLLLPPGCGRLQLAPPQPVFLQVRFPRGGERLRPQGQSRHRSLKNLFQEAAVPPWVRERTPLLFDGDELLAVGSFWRSELAANRGLAPVWTHSLPGPGPHGD